MAKVTKAEIADIGFSKEMFGKASAGDFDALIDAIIANQSGLLIGRIGAARYASTTVPIITWVKQAEECLVAAELCRRRIIRLTQDVKAEDGADAKKLRTTRSEYLNEADELVNKIIDGIGEDSSSFAGGAVISSHFAEDA